MFEEAGLKVWKVIMIILDILTRFHLSYKGRRALSQAKNFLLVLNLLVGILMITT